MTGRECSRILDGLILNERGELVLDEGLQQHLDECSRCREVYKSIQMAKAEEVPDYIPKVMQRLGEECSEILEGLVVDASGELVLDVGEIPHTLGRRDFQKHLEECSQCRQIYERIEAAKAEKVPDYVPTVIRRIREMEAPSSSERLKRFFSVWRKSLIPLKNASVLAPSVAAVAIIVMMILGFGLHRFLGRAQSDEYANLVRINTSKSLATFADMDKRINVALDNYVSMQLVLFQEDL